MSHAQHQALIGRYQQFFDNLNAAAERAYTPDQSAFYRKYATRMAGMIADLKVQHRYQPAGR